MIKKQNTYCTHLQIPIMLFALLSNPFSSPSFISCTQFIFCACKGCNMHISLSVCVCAHSPWCFYRWKLLSYYQASRFPYLLLCNLEEAGAKKNTAGARGASLTSHNHCLHTQQAADLKKQPPRTVQTHT